VTRRSPSSSDLVTIVDPTRPDPEPQWDVLDLDETDYDADIPERFQEAFDIRRRNFDNRISFYAPAIKAYETDEFSNCGSCSFAAVSITGPKCALQCDHCKTHVLRPMDPARTPEALWAAAEAQVAKGSGGLLVSGGSDLHNVVRMEPFFPMMKRIKEELGLRVLVHVGYADEAIAKGLAWVGVDSVMLDIIGDDRTVKEVYHLDWASTADYERTLDCLSAEGLPLSPHIVMGLYYGQIRGEYDALELISRYPVSSLVLVGLQPLLNTPMVDVTPPAPEEMGEIFRAARLKLPTTNILLGCERPYGDHKLRTDELAVKAGLNGIAYPAEGIVGLASALGLSFGRSGMCCSLDFQGL